MTEAAEAAGSAGPTAGRRTRPLGVVLFVLFQLGNVAANLLAVGGYLGPRTGSLLAFFGNDLPALDLLFVGLGLLSLAGAVALWRLRRFGWYVVMLLTGVGLAVQIVFYVWGTPNFINLAIFVVSAFYLNQSEVKDIFLAKPAEQERVILAAEEEGPR